MFLCVEIFILFYFAYSQKVFEKNKEVFNLILVILIFTYLVANILRFYFLILNIGISR
jgi:hypothetical protein